MQVAIDQTPWARAGLLLATAAAILLAFPIGRLLKSNPVIVGLLLAAFGYIFVFTLTPHYLTTTTVTGCYTKLSQPTRADLVQPTDFSLNILLFVPAGFLIMQLRPWFAVGGVALFASLFPIGIEYIQLTKTELGRTCSLLDVATNELGLMIGLAVGLLVRIIWEIVRATSNRARR